MPVVVGYVPTPEGAAAIETGIAEALLRTRPLVVVNVSRGESLVDERYADAGQLQALRTALEDAGLVADLRQRVDRHSPASQIVDIAIAENAELIVIGIRHRSPVGKFVFGSTAQEILLDAPCPVLAVKPHRIETLVGTAHSPARPRHRI